MVYKPDHLPRVCCCCCLVTKSCPILCNPMGCSPPVSSVYGISQARILEWVAISFSRGSSQSRDQTRVSYIGRQFLFLWATWEDPLCIRCSIQPPTTDPVIFTQLLPLLCTKAFSTSQILHRQPSGIKTSSFSFGNSLFEKYYFTVLYYREKHFTQSVSHTLQSPESPSSCLEPSRMGAEPSQVRLDCPMGAQARLCTLI